MTVVLCRVPFQVVIGADVVEILVHLLRGPRVGSLEHHVFEEMADAHDGRIFIARAGLDEETDRSGVRARIDLRHNIQSVGKRRLFELYGHASQCSGAPNASAIGMEFRW